jgi:hypothetical protein
MADSLSITTEILSLIKLAINLVVDGADVLNKTVPGASHEAADVLKTLQGDLEDLEKQVMQIESNVGALVSGTRPDGKSNQLLQQ